MAINRILGLVGYLEGFVTVSLLGKGPQIHISLISRFWILSTGTPESECPFPQVFPLQAQGKYDI